MRPSGHPPSQAGGLRRAYGLSFGGLLDVVELLPADGFSDAPVQVDFAPDRAAPSLQPTGSRMSVRKLLDGHILALDRAQRTATFYGPLMSPDVLAHPYLAPVATTFNRWAGRESFHAGAFVIGGRAWGVLGPRTAGKSTLLEALTARGVDVLADDILITDGAVVFRGPCCIDLRQPSLSGGLPAYRSRAGTRWRVALPGSRDQVPLGGWLFLRWGDKLDIGRVCAGELLGRLASRRGGRDLASDPSVLLSLATLPAWDLARPREWAQLDATLDVVEATIDGAPRAWPVSVTG